MYNNNVDGKMEFTPEEIAEGKPIDFLKVLMDNGCEIRLWTDGYCYIVEYLQSYRKEDGDAFLLTEDCNEREAIIEYEITRNAKEVTEENKQ